MRPRSITTMRSACSMVDSRWAMTSVVRPAMARVMACCTRRSLSVSSALVASSSSSTGASLYSARAMARRWRWPPDNCVALWPSTVSMSCGRLATWAARLASFRQRCTRSRSMLAAPSATLAATVSLSMVTSWLTSANCARRAASGQSAMSRPSSNIWPLSGRTKRGSRLTSVVLPDPDGPTSATVSPAPTSRLSAFSDGSAPSA